jgi:hypothetical protein
MSMSSQIVHEHHIGYGVASAQEELFAVDAPIEIKNLPGGEFSYLLWASACQRLLPEVGGLITIQ